MKNIRLEKKHYLIIILSMIIVFGIVFMAIKNQTNHKIIDNYVQAISEQKFEEAYEMLDSISKQKYSKEDFLSRYKNIYEGIEAKNINFVYKDKTDTGLIYTYHLETLAGNLDVDVEFKYNKEGVIFEDGYILPNLTQDKKVRVKEYEGSRGRILDRNGLELATKGSAYEVGLVKEKMSSHFDYMALSSLLDMTEEDIKKSLSQSWVKDNSFVPLKKISKDNQSLIDKLLDIRGIQLNTVSVRYYPFKEVTGHLIGYVSSITKEELEKMGEDYHENSMIGKTGLEASYEKELKGENGGKIYFVNSEGEELETVLEKDAKSGTDIMLTIDITLQNELYKQYQDEPGCSVAQNPITGEVLALVSTPSYDSNDFILGMSSKKWDQLNNNPNLPLVNRFTSTFAPGSTMKPITAMIAINNQQLDPDKDYQAEKKWQKSSTWGDYYVSTLHAASPNNLKNALVYSDNVYFAKASTRVGTDNFSIGLDQLYFNRMLEFDLPLKVSSYADLESEITLADSGYGQGKILINPVHLTTLYTAFLNEGKVIKPYLRKDQSPSALLIEQAISKEGANAILNDLEAVVASPEGTGHQAYMQEVAIAGKTGTAEIKISTDDHNGTEIGWFTAFTCEKETTKPIIITTMVQNVKNQGGSGKVVRGVKETLKFYFSR